MAPSGAKLPTCWKMHRRASHVILMHGRGFSTFRRGCVALQRVAGPIENAHWALLQDNGPSKKGNNYSFISSKKLMHV